MRKMARSDVLISGMRGLGLEIAKNVILGGVKSVTIHDEGNVELSDLSSQFYATEKDVGKNRAIVSAPLLGELNKNVPVNAFSGKLTPDFLSKFRVIVLTNSNLDEQLWISDLTHSRNQALIVASTKGLFGQVFCDFGSDFVIMDPNGEPPVSVMIASITKETNGIVTALDESRHGFEDGDYVTFTEVHGMKELNGCEPRKITVLGPYTFSIGDTSSFSDYVRGGIASQVKMPKSVSFKSLRESIKCPEFVLSDFAKFDRPGQLHVAFQALDEYSTRTGSLPRPWNKDDADTFVKIVDDVIKKDGLEIEVDKKLMEKFSFLARGDTCPMSAAIGGIVAQEVMKACSGKFGPINQWFYLDALECLPEQDLTAEETAPIGSR